MSTEFHNESFDNLFKSTFEGAKTSVPPGVWSGISAATTGASATGVTTGILSKLLGLKGAAILGGVALVSTIYFASTSQDNQDKKELSNSIQTTESTTTDVNNGAQEIVISSENADSKKEVLPNTIAVNTTSTNSTDKLSNSEKRAQSEKTTKVVTESPISKSNTPPTSAPNPKPFVDHSSPGIIVSMPEQVCLNQEATLKFERNYGELDKVTWFLNGAKLAENERSVKIIFTKSGLNLVKIKITTPANVTQEMSRTFDIKKANANFEYKAEDNQIKIKSTAVNASNKWFVNNLKQASTTSELVIPSKDIKSLEVVHIAGNLYGCNDTVTKTISLVTCNLENQLPDGFSPYAMDGINDEWIVDLPPVEKYYLIIFAFDGSVVFETENQNISWNGKRFNTGEILPAGVYAYQLVYGCNGNSKSQSGKINLVK